MNIEWLHPGALVGLAAIAGPIAVHMLRRHRAARVPFPTLRFVSATQATAVRFTAPSDRWLMVLRIAIVAAAAAAWAQPVLITQQRQDRMQQAIARAIVIDRSASTAPVASQLREAADAEHRGVAVALEIAAENLRDASVQAVDELRRAHAGRKEIVVISDFQHGAFSGADVAVIPSEFGVRFVSVDVPRSNAGDLLPTLATFGTSGVVPLTGNVTLEGPATHLTMIGGAAAAAAPRILAEPAEPATVERLLRTVARAGAPAASATRPVAMVFSNSRLPDVTAPRQAWMIQAILRMRDDITLRQAVSVHPADPNPQALGSPWVTIAPDRSTGPVVAVAAVSDRELIAYVAARPSDLIAAIVLRSMLTATSEQPAWREREPVRESAILLKKWTRAPTATPATRGTYGSPGDSRWMWGLVLVLIALEHVRRRSQRSKRVEEQAVHAA